MATLSSIVTAAKALGSVSVTAFEAIKEAETKSETYTGEEKTAYVIACVADEVGDQISDINTDLIALINETVAFLNEFSWATKVIAVLTSILSILSYVPSIFGWTTSVIVKGAELYFELKTGLDLDTKTGETTEKTDAE